MNLTKLVAISGRSGIYRMAANRSNGLIVEDLDSGKKFFVSGRIHQFTPLESISIYTTTEEATIELKQVFRNMLTNLETTPLVAPNDSAQKIKQYFMDVLPEFDRDKVLVSDMKKLIKWFNFLNQRNMLSLEEEVKEEEPATEAKENEEVA